MKDIVIRNVEERDAVQYITLLNYVWRIAYKDIFPEEVFDDMDERKDDRIASFSQKYYTDDERVTCVAEVDSKIVGIASGGMLSKDEYFSKRNFSDLVSLYVHPDYQGMGIATALKRHFEEWAKEHGATKYVIGVMKENKKARTVYEKWGGKLSEHEAPFIRLGKGYDEVFYTYNLD